MNIKAIIAGLCLIQTICLAQNKNTVWCFGDSARITFIGGSAIAGISVVNSRGSCASIADSNDSLLFYCSNDLQVWTVPGYELGGDIYNKEDTIMENGDSIIGAAWYNEHLIIPFPGTQNQYILFSLYVTPSPPTLRGLYYSIIDMSYNGGLGKVISKNNQLINPIMADAMTAIRHGNGRDWWLVCKPQYQNYSDTIYEFLITPTGISQPIKFKVGTASLNGFANFTFSHNGEKLLYVEYTGLIELYNFDRCTGTIGLDKTIQQLLANPPNYWGSCFSPNDSLIYVSNLFPPCKIRQYDLHAPSVISSEYIVANITGSQPPYVQRSPGQLKTAPDGKIYIACTANNGSDPYPYPDTSYYPDNMYLATIANPNVYGVGCNFNPYGFYLGGKRSYWGLPNNPDYEMGVWVGSACDTLLSLNPSPQEKEMLTAFPNPVEHNLTVRYNMFATKSAEIVIRDVLGNEVLRKRLFPTSNEVVLDVRKLSSGVYFMQVLTDKEKINGKFIKQ